MPWNTQLAAVGVSWRAQNHAEVAQLNAQRAEAAAQRLERQQFESTTTIQILDRAYRELTTANDIERRLTCSYLATLSSMEQASRESEPFFITDFLGQLARDGALVANCIPQVEAALAVQSRRVEAKASAEETDAETAEDADVSQESMPPGYPESFGRWQSLVASYSTSDCSEAQADVDEFADLLAGTVASGRPIYIAVTESTGYLAVTVDAGSDEATALAIRDAIRRASDRSADRRTGSDSFHVGTRNWFLDPGCQAAATIE